MKESTIIKFIDLNIDGNGTNLETHVIATGEHINRTDIAEYIQNLKSETDCPDTDLLVNETCRWLTSKGIETVPIDMMEIEF